MTYLCSNTEKEPENGSVEKTECENELVANVMASTPRTFGELYEVWLKYYKLSVKDSTYLHTEAFFRKHILPDMHDIRLEHINAPVLQHAVYKWHNDGKNAKKAIGFVSILLKYACKLEILTKNHTENLIIPKFNKKRNNRKAKFWDKYELKEFIELAEIHLPMMWYTFFRILAFSGARVGEIMALRWTDINFQKMQIQIDKTISRAINAKYAIVDTKTSSGLRVLDMDKDTMDLLARWKKEQTSFAEDIVFTSKTGDYITRSLPLKVFDRFCKNHSLIPITLHGLRHTHCSLLFEGGAKVKEVQDRLGHSDVQTTMDIYTHVTKNAKKSTLDCFFADTG